MNTDHKRTVGRQILTGLLLIPVAGGVLWILMPDLDEAVRPRIVFGAAALVALPLVAGIQMMLFRRYNSPQLIQGRTAGEALSLREVYLANTVEQVVLAAIAVLSSGFLVPAHLLKLPLIGAILFVAGRAAFYLGYATHPMKRFTGFVLGHYSSLTLLGVALYFAAVGR